MRNERKRVKGVIINNSRYLIKNTWPGELYRDISSPQLGGGGFYKNPHSEFHPQNDTPP